MNTDLWPARCRWTGLAVVAACLMCSAVALGQRSTPVQLLHPSGAASDFFGCTVAISGDTMVVGANQDDVGANSDQGSAHVYRWTGNGWAFEATLTATGGATIDQFGTCVAIDGDTIVVGAMLDNVGANTDQGSAFVFVRSGTMWTQQAQLVASDGAAFDDFGRSIAVSGNTVVVGANFDNVGANANQGSAYVFVRSGTTWTQQAQLVASDGAANDEFGVSVALSGDTAVVGAHGDDVGANTNQGSAYVFVRSGTTWTQQAQFLATGGAAVDQFGYSTALSGDTAVVGALFDDVGPNADQGSAYVFVRSGTVWTQQAQLVASGGAASDSFGHSIAISGETVVVGAYLDDVGPNADQGSAYVFVRSGTTWTQQAQLTAIDGAATDYLGYAVAIDGDTVVVGVRLDDVGPNGDQGSARVFSRIGSTWIGPDITLLASDGASSDTFGYAVGASGDTVVVGAHNDDVGANVNQGSVYVFVRSGTTWTQQAQLVASDGAAGDQFGVSVALSVDTAVVGAYSDDVGANADQGSAYVFVRSGTTWTQQAKLLATGGAAGDGFGISVALSGDTAVVGAFTDDVGANANQGSAYVFVRSGVTWNQQAQLLGTGGAADDRFGFSTAISGETVVVGAYLDDVGANTDQGSAFVYVRSGTSWSLQSQLTASDGATTDLFGYSVALSGDTALVGASSDDVGANTNRGSAYVFVRSGTTWTQQTQLTASDGAAADLFGYSVALSGDIAVVGAPNDNVGANTDQGSAYLFVRSGTTWSQQAQLLATGGLALDEFGASVALSGDTAVIGAWTDDAGVNTDQGSLWVFDVPAGDFVFARNDTLSVNYGTLSAALLAAQSGQQITGTQAAWRSIATLDTTGRSLALWSDGDLRAPSSSTITLGGSSSLNVDPGETMEIDGQLRASGYVDLTADSFLLGSRGILTARTNSSLTINAPVSNLEGQTRLEQGASLTLGGSATAIGPTTANLNTSLVASGTFANLDTFTITGGTIDAPLFWNRAVANIFGSSAMFGSFTNEAGAITTIRSGTLFVFGSLTNNGTIVGTICSGCVGTPPNLDVGGSLSIGSAANLTMPFDGSLVHVGGSFGCAIDSNARYDMALATLQLEGTGSEQTLEVMSKDIGADALGLDRSLAGHYPIGVLHVGALPSTVRLVDVRDNDGLGQASCEALYVGTLQIDAGSRLINPSCKIYYSTLVNNGVVDFPANLVAINPPCPSDFDHDGFVTGEDFDAYVAAFEAGTLNADFDGDGFVTGEDFDAYVAAFEAGC